MAASRSAVCSSRPSLRCASGSRSRTSTPGPGGAAGQGFQHIHRKQHHRAGGRLPGGDGRAAIADGTAGLRRLRNQQPQGGVRRENIGERFACKPGAIRTEKLLHRTRGENQPQFAVEDENRVFQILQQPVDIAAQIRDFKLRAAQAVR